MSNLLKKEKGFTLIEIVLVLAIAGLLLVIVFLAVSGAQKSRRDSQRKNDLSRIAASLESYASNNNGSYPTDNLTWTNFWNQYVAGANFTDPLAGVVYARGNIAATAAAPTVPAGGTPASVTIGVNGRTYNVCIGLEQGVQSCRTNQ